MTQEEQRNKGWFVTTGTKKVLGIAEHKDRIKAVFGGASASKTYSIIPVLINAAITNPGEIITIVSDTSRNLRDGAMRDFITIMQATNRWDRGLWNKTESKYTFRTGSIIEFLGADEPDKFRGPRRDRLYVNEANRIKYKTFDQMNARTRKEVWLDWNPTAPFWYDTEIKGRVPHRHLRLTYLDNDALSPGELMQFDIKRGLAEREDAKQYDINWWRVYGLGLTGQIEGACVKDFTILESNTIPDGYRLVGIGLDFGNNDPNAAVKLYKNDAEQFIFDELLYKPKLHIAQIYEALKPFDTYVYADYSWPQTIMELRKLGLTVLKCKKGPDSVKAGIDLLNEKQIGVTPRSENLIHEFNSYAYKMDKDGVLIDNKFEGPDHLVDACRYVLTRNINKRRAKILQF